MTSYTYLISTTGELTLMTFTPRPIASSFSSGKTQVMQCSDIKQHLPDRCLCSNFDIGRGR